MPASNVTMPFVVTPRNGGNPTNMTNWPFAAELAGISCPYVNTAATDPVPTVRQPSIRGAAITITSTLPIDGPFSDLPVCEVLPLRPDANRSGILPV